MPHQIRQKQQREGGKRGRASLIGGSREAIADEEEITFKNKSERLLSLIHTSSLSEYSMRDR